MIAPLPQPQDYKNLCTPPLTTMGWQSYVLIMKDIYARDQQEVNRILAVCMMHNACEDWDKVGETLTQVGMVTTKGNRQYIVCGNGGGRSLTFKWFDDHNVQVVPYEGEWIEKIQGDVRYFDLKDPKTWLYKAEDKK